MLLLSIVYLMTGELIRELIGSLSLRTVCKSNAPFRQNNVLSHVIYSFTAIGRDITDLTRKIPY